MSDKDETSEVQGHFLTKLDRFWLDTAQDLTKEAISSLESAAKQLIVFTSLLQVIYFFAISFCDLKKALPIQDFQDFRFAVASLGGLKEWLLTSEEARILFLVLLFALPILFWLMSLEFAVLLFTPKTYQINLNSPDVARQMYTDIVIYKHKQLQRAHKALLLGFVLLVVDVFVYLIILI